MAPVTALALALTIGGCGGSDDNNSTSGSAGASQTSGGDTTATTAGDGDTAQATEAAGTDSGDSGTTAGAAKAGGTLRVGTSLNPTQIGYTPEAAANGVIFIMRMAFNSLLFYDNDGNLIGQLAESWETDPAAKTLTFHLRSGVQFSDGTDFNAEAVKWNIEQYQSVQRTEVAAVASVDTPDETTVVINLSEWNSAALVSIGFFVYYMSPTAFEANGGADWARNNPVGTGPFVLKSFEQTVSASYTKNPNYWEGEPYVDQIDFTFFADPTVMTSALKAGEVDMITNVQVEQVYQLGDGDWVKTTNTNGMGLESVGLIPSSKDESDPFYKAENRLAMCYAIDNETLVAAFGHGLLSTTNQWAAPSAVTYNPNVVGCPYNPDKAKELLAEAGNPDGFDTTIYASAILGDWTTALADQLSAVGINATIEMMDATQQSAQMSDGWSGLTWHFASISPDLGLYMGRHLDPNGAFYAPGIQHPQDAVDLLNEIRAATDDETKIALEWELQSLIYDKYALFGKVLYVGQNYAVKAPYVMDDNWTVPHASAWTPQTVWLDK
ncbi:MAG: ABC transporter substrate-binding protein [Bifidobacteriaceae bacterium]|nr:ABC transporter substrate-binding protein [Bifidobacteriaceae bacterium]